jgi:hypothetical protein
VITQNPKSLARPYFAKVRVKTKAITAFITWVNKISLVSVNMTEILVNFIIRL